MKKSKNSKKEAKFFCESCGSEVPRNAKTCPTCGKFFASVRCPKCGKTGSTDEFKKGCPACGYAVHGQIYLGRKNNPKLSSATSNGNGYNLNKSKQGLGDGKIPIWIYIVCVCILIALVILLYSCL